MATNEDVKAPTQTPEWLYWLALVLVVIAPAQYAYAVDPKHGPFIGYADVAAALVVGIWVLWVLANRRLRQLVWAPVHVWALLAVAVLSGLGAQSLKAAAVEIVQLALYFAAAYMVFCDVLRSERRMRGAILALTVSTSLVILYGLAQYVTASSALNVKATFQSRNIYSAYLVMTLPVFFGLALRGAAAWQRGWYIAAVVLGALTILSPPLIWVLLLVLTVVAVTDGGRRVFAAYVASAVVFCIITVGLLPLNRSVAQELANPYEQGPIYKTAGPPGESPEKIVKKRWIEWLPSLNMMADNFMLGVGTGSYQLNIGQPEYYGFVPNVKKSEPDTNNLYLVEGSSMGFAGLVCLVAFMGYFWRRGSLLWTHVETPFERGLASGLHGAVVAIPVVNLFTSLFVRGSSLTWALCYALVTCLALRRFSTGKSDQIGSSSKESAS